MDYLDKDILSLDELEISVETGDPKNVPIIDDGIYQRSVKEIILKPKTSNAPLNEPEEYEDTSFLSKKTSVRPVIKNIATGESFDIRSTPFTVGKKNGNNLCINENIISRFHAEILQFDDSVFIKDLDSLNGTFVDGQKIPPKTSIELKNGQEIMFANLKFIIHW